MTDFGHALLEINPVTVFDRGEYTVVAVNTLGEARQTAIVEIVGTYLVSESTVTENYFWLLLII